MTATRSPSPLHALALHGDLDISTAPQLEERVIELLRDGAKFVVIDVSDVHFVDSSGVRALIHLDTVAAECDAVVRLKGVTAATRRVLELSGLIDRLKVA